MSLTAVLQPDLWVDAYADLLYRFTLSRICDARQAEDIVQDTFLSAFKARDAYNGNASEKNWLFAICKNKITDYYRRKAASAPLFQEDNDRHYFDETDHWTTEAQPAAWLNEADRGIDKREFYAALDRCRLKLKEMQNAVFSLKYLDDLRSDEICAQLGLSSANYWVLLHRAKLQLRACLEKHWINR